MSLKEAENDGKSWPDSQIDLMIRDLIDTALNRPEEVGLKGLALARYALAFNLANQFNYQLCQCIEALGSTLQLTLTQAGCQRSDFVIAAKF